MGIPSVSLDLIPLQFRMLEGGRQANGSASRVDLFREFATLRLGHVKQLLHHRDDVCIRMLGVVPKDDVVSRLTLGLGCGCLLLDFWLGNGGIG